MISGIIFSNDGRAETVGSDGSSFETVIGIAEKIQELKQNHIGYCFRRCILTFFRTVSRIGPKSFELFCTVSNVAPRKDGGF